MSFINYKLLLCWPSYFTATLSKLVWLVYIIHRQFNCNNKFVCKEMEDIVLLQSRGKNKNGHRRRRLSSIFKNNTTELYNTGNNINVISRKSEILRWWSYRRNINPQATVTLHTFSSTLLPTHCICVYQFCNFVQLQELMDHLDLGHLTMNKLKGELVEKQYYKSTKRDFLQSYIVLTCPKL